MTYLSETQQLIYNKVYSSIMEMKDGEIKELSPSHPNYENFIQCVKFIIDCKYDWLNGFSITFNNSYTKLRKDFLN